MAYRVAAVERQAVLERLDFREKGGYRLAEVGLMLAGDEAPTAGVVYIATPDNPNYLGPAPLDAIAAQVRACCGPSGRNIDYVLKLAEALRAIDAADQHVFDLARLVGEA
jgi:cation transport regulator ChaC